MQRFGEPKEKGRAYTDRPGAYAILQLGNKVLLTYQDKPHYEYQLPGGGVDKGEAIIAALHREVMEETGWSMAIKRRLGVYQRYVYMPEYDLWAHKICHMYLCRPARCIGPPLETDHTAIWTSMDEAIEILVNDGDRHFVQGLRR